MGRAQSPLLDEFLRRFVDPLREGRPIDLAGLQDGEPFGEARYLFSPDGRFAAVLADLEGGLQVMTMGSANENRPERDLSAWQETAPGVLLTRDEIDAFVAAFGVWAATTEGVVDRRLCEGWKPPVPPRQADAALLQGNAALRAADGTPAVIEANVVNLAPGGAAAEVRPIWMLAIVLTTGERQRCSALEGG
jgi:hypothetical protein